MRRFSLLAFIGVWASVIPAHAQVTNNYVLEDNYWNTATGLQALGYEFEYESSGGVCQSPSGTTYACGTNNTAVGQQAAFYNETGSGNTAVGSIALGDNFNGNYNTAIGNFALLTNTASANTATGYEALYKNTTGNDNTASGYSVLYSNTSGSNNSAFGYQSLYRNTSGVQNTAAGNNALYANTRGDYNTASGSDALHFNTTGKYNTALGWEAGYNLTTGSYNIEIGSPGESTDGVAENSAVIRIGTITDGTSSQSATYIAGIYGVKTATAGTAVVIDSSGQLGTVSSSIRYKEDIQPMAEASERLLQLRPVKFRYKKADASGEKPMQYGLIAEEVAKVYPELVVRDAATGRIDGVRYDELAPMLLNEVQQQQQKIRTQAAQLRDVLQQLAVLKEVSQATQVALRQLQSKDEIVAQR
jgi:hypothetical protein